MENIFFTKLRFFTFLRRGVETFNELDVSVQCEMQYCNSEEYETEKCSFFEFLSMGRTKLRFYVETSEILNKIDVNVQCKMQYEEYEMENTFFFRISLDGTNEIYVFSSLRFYV